MPPIVEMFWVAEYWGGNALPQYDPFSGVEHSFSEVEHKQVKRFWWLPITPSMAKMFPDTRYNPLLERHGVELDGSKGFVCRRHIIKTDPIYSDTILCYVLGIEGGPRQEIYPDGSVISRECPAIGETQELLHG
jgi:hypothetical protein